MDPHPRKNSPKNRIRVARKVLDQHGQRIAVFKGIRSGRRGHQVSRLDIDVQPVGGLGQFGQGRRQGIAQGFGLDHGAIAAAWQAAIMSTWAAQSCQAVKVAS